MTQEKQDRDEIRWVTEMASVMGIGLRAEPAKQDVPKADVALTIAENGRMRRVDVEVVEAMYRDTRAGYSGALSLLVSETTEELTRRRLNAHAGLMFAAGVAAEIHSQPKERRLMPARIADLVADSLTRPRPAEFSGWVWRDEALPLDERRLVYLGLLSSWGIGFLRGITVTPWTRPRVTTAAGEPMAGPRLIQEAIDKKVAKRAKYVASTSDADEVWLLVVGGHCVGSPLRTYVATRQSYTSPFARTFFLEAGERKCVALATAGGAPTTIGATWSPEVVDEEDEQFGAR